MVNAMELAAVLLHLEPMTELAAVARERFERQLGTRLPGSVAELLRYPGMMPAVAATWSGHVVFPESARLARPEDMPGARGRILRLLTENQGVCCWGVALDAGDDPPVLVGGDLEAGQGTVEYAPSVGAFAYAFVWEGRLLAREPVIQAQAAPLDARTLAYLQQRYRELPAPAGWPARTNLRFESDGGLALSLWSGDGQCDWWISADDERSLEAEVALLVHLSNLRASLWSNEVAGEHLLGRVLNDEVGSSRT
jgi:hypothetical protein